MITISMDDVPLNYRLSIVIKRSIIITFEHNFTIVKQKNTLGVLLVIGI